MLCPICGRENPDGAKFCRACGTTLTIPEPVQPAGVQPPVPEQPPIPTQPPVQQPVQQAPQAPPVWTQPPQPAQPVYGYPVPAPETLQKKTPIALWIARIFALVGACSLFFPFLGGDIAELISEISGSSSGSLSGFGMLRELWKVPELRSEEMTLVFAASLILPVLTFLLSWIPRKGGAVAALACSLVSLAACVVMVFEILDEFGKIGRIDGFGVSVTIGICTLVGLAASLLVAVLAVVALLSKPKQR